MEGAKINTISRETIPWRDNTFWKKIDRDVQLLNCWRNLQEWPRALLIHVLLPFPNSKAVHLKRCIVKNKERYAMKHC